jgi:uncharacterized protein YciI
MRRRAAGVGLSGSRHYRRRRGRRIVEGMTDTAQFLYRIVPTRLEMLVSGPTEREMQVINEHFAHLQKLAADGVVLMAGRTVDTGADTWGIVVFTAASTAEAETVMRSDPAIAQGVMRCELFPYRVAVWSEQFRLGA